MNGVNERDQVIEAVEDSEDWTVESADGFGHCIKLERGEEEALNVFFSTISGRTQRATHFRFPTDPTDESPGFTVLDPEGVFEAVLDIIRRKSTEEG